MTEIDKYGDLSEKELLAFLHEIEDENDALEEDIQKVQALDDEDVTTEEPESVEEPEEEEIVEVPAFYSEAANYKKSVIASIKSETPEERATRYKRWSAERRLLKTKIQRAAFDQAELDLTAPFTQEDFHILLHALTAEKKELINKCELFINRRLTWLLNPLIPRVLRSAYSNFPQSVLGCQGFLYRTSERFGSKIFFVQPNIPYYFEQGTELDALKECKADFVDYVDSAVEKYYRLRDELTLKEMSVARIVKQFKIDSYFALLRHNVLWFSRFYLAKTGKPLNLIKE